MCHPGGEKSIRLLARLQPVFLDSSRTPGAAQPRERHGAIDPVCGMKVSRQSAAGSLSTRGALGTSDESRLEKFEADPPVRWLSASRTSASSSRRQTAVEEIHLPDAR